MAYRYMLITHVGNVLIVWQWLADTDLPQSQSEVSSQHPWPCNTSVKVQTHTRYPSSGRILLSKSKLSANLRGVPGRQRQESVEKWGESRETRNSDRRKTWPVGAGRRLFMAPFKADALGASAFVTHRDIGISASDNELYKP